MSNELSYFSSVKPAGEAVSTWSMRIGRLVRSGALFLGWAILTLIVIAALVVVFGWAMSPLAAMVFILSARHVSRVVRRRRGRIVLGYVAQAIRLNLPLPRMLEAAERAEGPRVRRRLDELRKVVESGVPVGMALAGHLPELPEPEARLLIAAERLGQLPAALKRLTDASRRCLDEAGAERAFFTVYPLMLTILVLGVGAMMTVLVFPKFSQILYDFGMPPHPLMAITAMTIQVGAWVVLALAGAALASYLITALAEAIRQPRPRLRGGLLEEARDRIAWHIPLWGSIVRDQGLAEVFHAGADALEAGFSLPRVLAEALELRLNWVLRERLSLWAQGIEAGASYSEAARQARLPALVPGMLGSTAGSARAAEVFRFLAHYYSHRFSRGLMLLRAAAIPTTALIFGGITLLIELSMVLPMLKLLELTGEFKLL